MANETERTHKYKLPTPTMLKSGLKELLNYQLFVCDDNFFFTRESRECLRFVTNESFA